MEDGILINRLITLCKSLTREQAEEVISIIEEVEGYQLTNLRNEILYKRDL